MSEQWLVFESSVSHNFVCLNDDNVRKDAKIRLDPLFIGEIVQAKLRVLGV